MSKNKKYTHESGFNLIGIMFLVSIIGVLSAVYINLFSNNLAVTKKIEVKEELEDLRRYITVGTSLSKTKESLPTPCNADTIVSLKREKDGAADLVASANLESRTRLGIYFLQASCTNTPKEIEVFYSTNASSKGTALLSSPLILP